MTINDFEMRASTIRYKGIDVAEVRKGIHPTLIEDISYILNGAKDKDRYKNGYDDGQAEGHRIGYGEGIGKACSIIEGFNPHSIIIAHSGQDEKLAGALKNFAKDLLNNLVDKVDD